MSSDPPDLKLSEGFTKPVFTVSSLFWYGASFCYLSMTLKSLPVGAAYAVWSGLGSVLTSPVGYFLFAQKRAVASIVDMVMIVAGRRRHDALVGSLETHAFTDAQ